jgi:putative FmdB family regulatory protein
MPLHEYSCTSCGHRFEVLQRLNAAPLRECPQCGGALTKLVSAPALQFKGSGFYLTDYGRAGGGKPGTDGPKAEGAGEKPVSSESKATGSESKPAADSKPAAESKPAATSEKKAS